MALSRKTSLKKSSIGLKIKPKKSCMGPKTGPNIGTFERLIRLPLQIAVAIIIANINKSKITISFVIEPFSVINSN